LLEDTNEISDILGRSYGIGDEIEDEDLDAELACLEDELEGEDLELDTPAYLQPLPQQPGNIPVSQGEAKEEKQASQVDEFGLPVQTA
jgi:charged multivesicular body protein 5